MDTELQVQSKSHNGHCTWSSISLQQTWFSGIKGYVFACTSHIMLQRKSLTFYQLMITQYCLHIIQVIKVTTLDMVVASVCDSWMFLELEQTHFCDHQLQEQFSCHCFIITNFLHSLSMHIWLLTIIAKHSKQ